MNIFGLSAGQTIGMFVVGYLIINGGLFLLECLGRFLGWGFHAWLAHLAKHLSQTAEDDNCENS